MGGRKASRGEKERTKVGEIEIRTVLERREEEVSKVP